MINYKHLIFSGVKKKNKRKILNTQLLFRLITPKNYQIPYCYNRTSILAAIGVQDLLTPFFRIPVSNLGNFVTVDLFSFGMLITYLVFYVRIVFIRYSSYTIPNTSYSCTCPKIYILIHVS